MPQSDAVRVKQIDIVKNDIEMMKSEIDSLNLGLAALKREIKKLNIIVKALKSIEEDKINDAKGGWWW